MQTTIDEAGRIVIPKSIREQAGLRPGVPLDIEFVRGCVEIVPATMPTRLVDEGGVVVLVPEGGEEVSVDAIRLAQEGLRGGG